MNMKNEVWQITQEEKKRLIEELFEFLTIPSVSGEKEHQKDILKASYWLKEKLTSLGFRAKIIPTQGNPVVYGELLPAKGKPTILIYGHYDVQSPDPLEEWQTPPFQPEIRDNNIYARGVSDDKGQLFSWLAALDLFLKKNKDLPVNIKFLFEGEEEMGSKNLEAFVRKNKSLLKANVAVISDSHCLSEVQPVITYGLKGITYLEVEVKTLAKDAHSGLYGGNVLNAVQVLCEIIGKLKDKDHKILIPGFYEKVRKLSPQEKKNLQRFPLKSKHIKEEVGAKVVVGEKGFSIPERAGARPTLDINGIWGGYQGEGSKTIIPAKAGAKISMRLVPYQDPSEIAKKFQKYVKEITPKGAEVSFKTLATAEPILMNINTPFFKLAEKAYQKVFGRKPLYELAGGSIPVTAIFKKILGLDSILMGYGLPDDGLHSPNEKFSLTMLDKGIKTNLEFIKGFRDF